MSDLVALLREDAASFARATQLMADAKSSRNQSAGDEGSCYSGLTPQQTRAWKAADEIERLTERCAAYKGQVEAGSHEIERMEALLGRAADELERISMPEDDVDGLVVELRAHQQSTTTETK